MALLEVKQALQQDQFMHSRVVGWIMRTIVLQVRTFQGVLLELVQVLDCSFIPGSHHTYLYL